MEQFITGIGLTICNLVLDMRYGEIQVNILVNIIMEERRGLEPFYGKIKTPTNIESVRVSATLYDVY